MDFCDFVIITFNKPAHAHEYLLKSGLFDDNLKQLGSQSLVVWLEKCTQSLFEPKMWCFKANPSAFFKCSN